MSLLSLINKGLKIIPKPSVPMWLVMGNESCDLDSTVSAIAYSILLSSEGHPSSFVLNTTRSDFTLKTEVCYWLNKHKLSPHNLVFRDDISFSNENKLIFKSNLPHQSQPLEKKESTGSEQQNSADDSEYFTSMRTFQDSINNAGEDYFLKVCLVDHHILASKDSLFQPYVAQIIDHRPLEKTDFGGLPVVHSIVASCCTLVGELVLQRQPTLLQEVAELLHGCIVLDSINCSTDAGIIKPRDLAVLQHLEQCCSDTLHRTKVFNELVEAKRDVAGLSSSDLLRRDMKIASDISLCSMPHPAQWFLSRADAASALERHTTDGRYRLTVVQGITLVDGAPVRDIALYSPQLEFLQKACMALTTSAEANLKLEEDSATFASLLPSVRYFKQHNAKATRKQVLPIMKVLATTTL